LLAIRHADQARTDFAAIGTDLEMIMAQIARLPTRADLARAVARAALVGMLACSAAPASSSASRYCSAKARHLATRTPSRYRGRRHSILGANVDAHRNCDLCRLGSSIDHFGASRPLAPEQARSNRTR
jgi:hypothetical protein